MASGSGEMLPWSSVSNTTCVADLSRNSCLLDSTMLPSTDGVYAITVIMRDETLETDLEQQRDAIASVRLVISLFSIIGALSIIGSVILRKQVTSPKIHPIFVLSLANCLLSFTWVIGGTLWFTRTSNKTICLVVSLFTVMLECVSVNLTLVYAIVSNAIIKRTNVNSMLSNMDSSGASPQQSWPPYKTFLTYLIAWTLPVLLVMTAFGLDAGMTNLLDHIQICSCWCLPYFGNVVPLSFKMDLPSAIYNDKIAKLVASYGVILGTNYLIVFILLLAIYHKILKRIRKMKRQEERKRTFQPHYGAVNTLKLIAEGESKARKRAVYFMTVFIIHGFFNVLFAYSFTVYESLQLHHGIHVMKSSHKLHAFPLTLYIFESVTAPLQGLLNAIVYGWTKEDFLEVIRRRKALGGPKQPRKAIDGESYESIDGGHYGTQPDQG